MKDYYTLSLHVNALGHPEKNLKKKKQKKQKKQKLCGRKRLRLVFVFVGRTLFLGLAKSGLK